MEASNSFPSNLHPIFQYCDNQLRRLVQIPSTITTTTSSSFSGILSQKLHGLEDLYESVEKLIQEPLAQRAFVRLGHGDGWADQVLDGSLRQLDACSAAKDAVLHTKERAREVQSVTRRRRGADRLGLESELEKYFASRKVVKKAAQKALKNLKSEGNTKGSFSSSQNSDGDSEIVMMELVGVLREVELVSLGVFESLLCFVSGTRTQSAKWSFVSKFCRSKRVGCEVDVKVVNEFENVDEIVHTLMCCETKNKCDHSLDCIENVKTQLQNLEYCVQDFEERLERLFRRLIRTRVSLLNILNN